jgi:ABC-type phosphate/phosphonate transport system substrate-binding protein
MSVACLPWYELPETQAAQDALWSVLAQLLRKCGVPSVPDRLTRGLPVLSMLINPQLLISQCCGYDLIYGFASCVQLIATPCYRAPGCDGAAYRSLVLVRDDCEAQSLERLRGGTCVVNGFNSHSGTNAMRALVAPLSRNGRFFSNVKVSGAHINSLACLVAGKADVMAMDCVLHALLDRHRPNALNGTRVLCWSEPVPAPPIVTSASADRELIDRLRDALSEALSDESSRDAREAMLLDGVALLPLQDYAKIIDTEGVALRYGYKEMHATTPALAR